MTILDKLRQALKSIRLYRRTKDVEHLRDVVRWLRYREQEGA